MKYLNRWLKFESVHGRSLAIPQIHKILCLERTITSHIIIFRSVQPVAEFKEFEPRFKYGWFHLKLYQMFQDLSRRLI